MNNCPVVLMLDDFVKCITRMQVDITARGSASLIRLIPDAVLDKYEGHCLQDVELHFENVSDPEVLEHEDDDRTFMQCLDYDTLVKDVADKASPECDGKTLSCMMVIQVEHQLGYQVL
jgi:hypothetical protein